MNISPVNRMLVIRPTPSSTTEKESILVPDDYKVQVSPYQPYKVLDVAEDCSIDVSTGNTVVVDDTMISKIELNGQEHYLLLENYVFAQWEKDNV